METTGANEGKSERCLNSRILFDPVSLPVLETYFQAFPVSYKIDQSYDLSSST